MNSARSQNGNSSFERSGIATAAARPSQSLPSIGRHRVSHVSPVTAGSQRSLACPADLAVTHFGGITVDFSGAEAHRGQVQIALTAHQFRILKYFIDNPGRVIGRQELLDQVWGYNEYPTTRTVDNQICKLRLKLEPDPKNPSYFLTVHGFGYKLVREGLGRVVPASLLYSQSDLQRNPRWRPA
jgi:DNA-binding response OmpR family regulator